MVSWKQKDEDYAMLNKNRYFNDPPVWVILAYIVLIFSAFSVVGILLASAFHWLVLWLR